MEDDGFDLKLTGFSDDELADLLEDGDGAGNTDEDAVPEAPVDPVTKLGDIYVLGNHRLLCGDSTILENVERVLDGSLADMVFTDPPYNVDYGNTVKDKMRGNNRTIMNDNLGEGFEQFLYDACVNMLTVCKTFAHLQAINLSAIRISKADSNRKSIDIKKATANQCVSEIAIVVRVTSPPPLSKKPTLSPDNRAIEKGQFPQGFRAKAVDLLCAHRPRKWGHFSLYRGILSKTSEPIDAKFRAFSHEISKGCEGAVLIASA